MIFFSGCSIGGFVEHMELPYLEIDSLWTGQFGTWRDCQYFVHVHLRWLCIAPNRTNEPDLTLLTQDLKDFGREAGSVSFADIDRDNPGQGYVAQSYAFFVSR